MSELNDSHQTPPSDSSSTSNNFCCRCGKPIPVGINICPNCLAPQVIARKSGMSGCLIVLIVCLALCVPLAGILAAIAIPAYKSYTIRANVSELMVAAGAARTDIQEFSEDRGRLPAVHELDFEMLHKFKMVESVNWDGDSIIVVGKEANLGAAVTVILTAEQDPSTGAIIGWYCSTPTSPKYVPANCR